MQDKYNDKELLDLVERLRKQDMEQRRHPLDSVRLFLRNQSNPQQLKRLYGCTGADQAAGRATHGDAFRMPRE